MIFNTHTHLNVKQFNETYDQVIKDSILKGLTKILVVGFNKETIEKAIMLAEKYEEVYATVGWHPVDAIYATEESFELIEKYIEHPKVLAVGECGLDYHWDTSPKEVQMKVFKRQIELAIKYNKPLIVHSRDSIKDTYEFLLEEGASEVGGIMHCYTGSVEMVKDFIGLNFLISLAGPVTFKNAKTPKEVARIVPLDKLLVETDCPYLAPEPFRGKQNKAYYVTYILEEIAKIKEIDLNELKRITYNNAIKLFGIGE
ncbi:TatD family hydrolase [Mycoplasmatota bacterium zrk1]